MKKKANPALSGASVTSRPVAQAASTDPVSWPEEFASPRTAIAILVMLFGLGAVLFSLAYFNHLLWLKVIIAYVIGLFDPAYVQATSWDIAIVVWGLALAIGAGCVHPCLGLIVLALFRPWLDGYVFPTDNMYFLWGILVFFALCGVRALFRAEPLRFGKPILLLAGFCAVATLSLVRSVDFGQSYRALLLWFSYLALFVVSSNTLRSRTTSGLLLMGIAVAMAAETVFSLLHYHYMLPYLRRMAQDPQVLRYFFETNQVTPELARRLNVNRAFGSMLFPNALAGFLILGIPFSLAGAVLGWRSLIPAWRAPASRSPGTETVASKRYRAAAVGVVAWLLVTCIVFVLAQFPLTFHLAEAGLDQATPSGVPWFADVYLLAGLSAVIGLGPAAILFWLVNRGGVALAGRAIWALGLSTLAPLQGFALLLTFSRGGMLALCLALAAGAVLFVGSAWFPWRAARPALAGAAAVLLVLSLFAAAGTPQTSSVPASPSDRAQPTPDTQEDAPEGQPPAGSAQKQPVVTDQGITLQAADMLELASMKLRLSYWRVGLAMWRHHFWTGVGLGNFRVAYPKYQYLGAGDVREAHNSILQVCCETGLVGGLFIVAFCAYMVLWGAWRVLREPCWPERLLLAGLFAGILAFLLHAGIDIHFSHPSLMMSFILFCGLFCARATLASEPAAEPIHCASRRGATHTDRAPRLRYQLVALPLLAFAAIAVGMSMRVYLQDLALSRVSLINVADRIEMIRRYQAARLLSEECTDLKKRKSHRSQRRPVAYFLPFFPDINTLASLGPLYQPMPGTARGARQIQSGEEVLPNAWIVITKPQRALNRCYEAGLRCVQELEAIDRRFPHDPEVAMHLQQWCELLATLAYCNPSFKDGGPAHQSRALHWAEEAVRRSPMHGDLHVNYGHALWNQAGIESGTNRMERALDALEQFRLATILTPTMSAYQYQYAYALEQAGKAYRSMGDEEKAQEYFESAEDMRRRGQFIQEERIRLGCPPE